MHAPTASDRGVKLAVNNVNVRVQLSNLAELRLDAPQQIDHLRCAVAKVQTRLLDPYCACSPAR